MRIRTRFGASTVAGMFTVSVTNAPGFAGSTMKSSAVDCFQTDDPRQVNFYMHRYVGCWQSNDAKNFSFMGAEPGWI